MSTIKVLVDAGKANAGPPIGPALGPLGVNTMEIVQEINNKTKELEGIQVPVKIHINADKSYNIEVCSPLTSALLKKELNIKKGVGSVKTETSGNLSFDQLLKVVNAKYPQLNSRTKKQAVKEILGSCRSMAVTIDKQEPSVILKKLNAGEFDSKF